VNGKSLLAPHFCWAPKIALKQNLFISPDLSLHGNYKIQYSSCCISFYRALCGLYQSWAQPCNMVCVLTWASQSHPSNWMVYHQSEAGKHVRTVNAVPRTEPSVQQRWISLRTSCCFLLPSLAPDLTLL
jgi:hypothetical protein